MTELLIVIVDHGGLSTVWAFVRFDVVVIIVIIPFFVWCFVKFYAAAGAFH